MGPLFVGSLERIPGITRDKVLEVLVDVLVGRPPSIPTRCGSPPAVTTGR